MSLWTPRARFLAAVAGERADRPPVSAWRHFLDREHDAASLAAATVAFQLAYDWDFVKLNPRATYYAEAFGNRYDFESYDGVVPRVTHHVLRAPSDLWSIGPLGAKAPPFAEQLEVIRLVRGELGPEVPILQTLFSPLAVLEYLAGHRTPAGQRPAHRADAPLPRLAAAEREGVHHALQAITETLAAYGEAARRAGADGFFFAVLGLARSGYLSQAEWEEFGRRYDLELLEAVAGGVVVLHTCGPNAHPERFADYPVHVLHWASRAQGNPPLAGARAWSDGKVVMGGVAEELCAQVGAEERIREQVWETCRSLAGEPFLLAPGCGVPPSARDGALLALREAAEDCRRSQHLDA